MADERDSCDVRITKLDRELVETLRKLTEAHCEISELKRVIDELRSTHPRQVSKDREG